MGWPSCFEVISEKLSESQRISETLKAEKISPYDASQVVEGILKQCRYIGEFASDFLALSKANEESLLREIYNLRENLRLAQDQNSEFKADIKSLHLAHSERRELLKLKDVDLKKCQTENGQLRNQLRNPARKEIKKDIARLSDLEHKKKVRAAKSKKSKPKGARVWRA